MASQSSQIVLFFTIVCLLVLLLIGIIVAIVFFHQKKSIKYLADIDKLRTEHEKTLLTTQLEIQEATLQNISREIHDNIGLSLTLAKLHLNTSDASSCKNSSSPQEAIDLITNAINNLRTLSRTLNSDFVLNNGLIKTIEKELAYFKSIATMEIDLQIVGNPVFMDAAKELVVFRIAQEAYNNAIKHSNGKKITTIINFTEQEFQMNIIDDGHGFDVSENSNHSGLLNMVQRAKLLKGKCSIIGTANGTTVSIIIPY